MTLQRMRKSIFIILLLLIIAKFSNANHISGGEMIYEYLSSASNGSKVFRITLRLFRDNNGGGAQMPGNVFIGVFNNDNNTPIQGSYFDVGITNSNPVSVIPPPPCMQNPPTINYSVGIYQFEVTLPNNTNGYTASYQTCCRINPLQNVFTQNQPAQGEGSTYICTIPGSSLLSSGNNSSPQFKTELGPVCYNNDFTFDFGAIDPDGDSLVFSFCEAYNRGASTSSANVNPTTPPYQAVQYVNGFSASVPLGTRASINTRTGLISGIAPPPGRYVVCVCINEYRNGRLIGRHRKDFILNVSDCSLTKASLAGIEPLCDGFTKTFSNMTLSGNVQTYFWDFGDGNTSTVATPTHTYADTGTYILKLVLNRGLACSDSDVVRLGVFPGFFPAFDVLGQCKNTPIQFNDRTTATYGVVNFWSWNFGDAGSPTNTSALQNPTHVYANTNTYNVSLIVASSKGCRDTIIQPVLITDKPAINAGRDTLICSIDTLQLNAVGTGSFLWQPNYMISSLTIPNPLVSPNVSTDYVVTLTDPFGCVGSDTIRINVVDFVTQSLNPDTSICLTDLMTLNLQSNALNFTWTETPNNNTITNANIKNPVVRPLVNTTYRVNSRIGKCTAQNDITVRVVPYPNANAGLNITICPGQNAQLNATGGSIYTWSPAAFLNDRNIANPLSVAPTSSVRYVVTVTDVLGCPKPVRDTVLVNVDRIVANAGPADTSVVLGQPVVLTATGSTNYLWSPATWLSSINTASTISRPQNNITYRVRVSNDVGCFDEDTIRVNVYFIEPGFNVPNAFTPNGDGKNDKFRPIAIGMQSVEVFRVYNRFGQLLFSSPDVLKSGGGWDGTFRGRGQDPATYVWYAEGTTYQNVKIKRKGTVVLIRE
jgi:gliding motility-associated-like protein